MPMKKKTKKVIITIVLLLLAIYALEPVWLRLDKNTPLSQQDVAYIFPENPTVRELRDVELLTMPIRGEIFEVALYQIDSAVIHDDYPKFNKMIDTVDSKFLDNPQYYCKSQTLWRRCPLNSIDSSNFSYRIDMIADKKRWASALPTYMQDTTNYYSCCKFQSDCLLVYLPEENRLFYFYIKWGLMNENCKNNISRLRVDAK